MNKKMVFFVRIVLAILFLNLQSDRTHNYEKIIAQKIAEKIVLETESRDLKRPCAKSLLFGLSESLVRLCSLGLACILFG
jgi:hypothetical protein